MGCDTPSMPRSAQPHNQLVIIFSRKMTNDSSSLISSFVASEYTELKWYRRNNVGFRLQGKGREEREEKKKMLEADFFGCAGSDVTSAWDRLNIELFRKWACLLCRAHKRNQISPNTREVWDAGIHNKMKERRKIRRIKHYWSIFNRK